MFAAIVAGADSGGVVCSGKGTCGSGAHGSGLCTCTVPYSGTDCNDVVISSVASTPATIPTELVFRSPSTLTGVTLVITGFSFGASGLILSIGAAAAGALGGIGGSKLYELSGLRNRVYKQTPEMGISENELFRFRNLSPLPIEIGR